MTSFKDRLIKSFPVFSKWLAQPIAGCAIVSGGAAGDLSVSGIKKDDALIGVVDVSGNTNALATGGAAGDITVSGIVVGDVLVSVINLTDVTDVTSEFSITAADTINNDGGTATTGDTLLVIWEKAKSNLASEFSITADGTINNVGGTATTGKTLLVSWIQWGVR